MASIAVAGHICVDLKPRLESVPASAPGTLTDIGPMRVTAGGCVGNTGRVLADLGIPLSVHAVVGGDALGDLLISLIDRPGVEQRIRRVDDETTSYSIVVETPERDRAFWHHSGANAAFGYGDLADIRADIVHIGYPSLLPRLTDDDARNLMSALTTLRDVGATISLDLAVPDPRDPRGPAHWRTALQRIAPLVDIISPSIDDLRFLRPGDPRSDVDLAMEFADLLVDWGVAVAVISSGSAGLVMRSGGIERLRKAGAALSARADAWHSVSTTCPAIPLRGEASANGAGDASSAGLLAAVLKGAAPAEALSTAVSCAAAAMQDVRPALEIVADITPATNRFARA